MKNKEVLIQTKECSVIYGTLKGKEFKKYSATEIRSITYENCPLKCTGCKAICNEMAVKQCRENLSAAFDKEENR